MSTCSICNTPNEGGGYKNLQGGLDHRHCHEKQHPPMTAVTVYQMARGRGDPVLAAEVIAEMVPDDLSAKIVDEFNRRLLIQWQRRCEP